MASGPSVASVVLAEVPSPANATGNATAMEYEEPDAEEMQHAILAFYLVLFVMFFAQGALVKWRRQHKRSYDLATLVGLWLIPPIISVQLGCWRFVVTWVFYSGVTGHYMYRCSAKKLAKEVPKQVYAWFMIVFRLSVGVGFAGYVLLLLEFTGVGMLLRPVLGPGAALTAIWYGLYYGILTRDSAEVASDRIAKSLGTGRKMAVSVRNCGICAGELGDEPPMTGTAGHSRHSSGGGGSGLAASGSGGGGRGGGGGSGLGTIQLSCKHLFHMECIRGWCIIGKKDTCPTCWEKVDLRDVFGDKPWETRNLSWIQMLDMVRYLVVWNPIIFLALHFIFQFTGLDHPPEHHGHGHGLNGTMLNGTMLNGTMLNGTMLNGTVLNGTMLNGTAAALGNATAAVALDATAAAADVTARLLRLL